MYLPLIGCVEDGPPLPVSQRTDGLSAALSQEIKLDTFGYRPGDKKIAIVTNRDPGTEVEIRDKNGAVKATLHAGQISYKGLDGVVSPPSGPSGDTVWWVDFTAFKTPGTYHLYIPAWGEKSYEFKIADDVYDEVVRTALKTFYHYRCSTPRGTGHAGPWSDSLSCHPGHKTVAHAPGEPDLGKKDLSGGWHLGGHWVGPGAWSVYDLVAAHEQHPGVFRDGDLNIPEFANGFPDILDEARWELDWLLKMQLPDGSLLSRVFNDFTGCLGPPSADRSTYYYYKPKVDETSQAVAGLARAARVFLAAGDAAYAAKLKTAAMAAWSWLLSQTTTHGVYKVWAAAEIYRLDQTQTAARAYVDAHYVYQHWMRETVDTAFTYIETPGATAATVKSMKASIGADVDWIFSNDDLYRSGMHAGHYHWGSNGVKVQHALRLLGAARVGATGSHTAQQCKDHALDFYHYLHGKNALRMTYLSNMAAVGGDHSVFQVVDEWFAGCSTYARAQFVGKPPQVNEPAYPYVAADSQVSMLGPLPGLLVGGPNSAYTGSSSPPSGQVYLHRFYRDSNSIDKPWETNENYTSTSASYVALGAHFMSAKGNDLAVTAAASAEMVQRGKKVTYTVTYLNRGSSTVNNVTVEDLLPKGLMFVSASPSPCQQDTGRVKWCLGKLGPGATGTLTVVTGVLFDAPAAIKNRVEIDGDGHAEKRSNDVPLRTVYNPVDGKDLMDNGRWSMEQGVHGTLSYSTKNCSSSPGSGGCLKVQITDKDNNQWSYFSLAGATPVNWCPVKNGYLTMVVHAQSDPEFNIDLRAIINNKPWQVINSVPGKVDRPGHNHVVIPLSFPPGVDPCKDPVTQVDFLLGGAKAQDIYIDQVEVVPALPPHPVKQTADRAMASPGETVTFTISYENSSTFWTNPGVRISDQLPGGLTHVSSTPPATDMGGGVYQWLVGDVPPGGKGSVQIKARVSKTAALVVTNKVKSWGTRMPTVHAAPVSVRTLFNGLDQPGLDDNGTWFMDAANHGVLSSTTSNCSQGSRCMDIEIKDTDSNQWSWLMVKGFSPKNWCAHKDAYLVMDVWSQADASFYIDLVGGTPTKYWRLLHSSANRGRITRAGMNSDVAIHLDLTAGGIDPCTEDLSYIAFVLSGVGAQHVHLDNVRVRSTPP